MFSVIVPIYNADAYLERCINSILASLDETDELLLVNDGSSDNSESICKEFQKKHKNIAYYYKENGGVSSARNCGIEAAKQEWVVFVDSDDYIISNSFEKIRKVIASDKIDFMILSQHFHEEKRYLSDDKDKTQLCLNVLGQGVKKLLTNYSTIWSKVYKTEIIKTNEIRFRDNINNGEDIIFNLEYLQYCKSIIELQCKFYAYCENATSLTKRYNPSALETDLSFLHCISGMKQLNLEKRNYEELVIGGIWIVLRQQIAHKDNPASYSQKVSCFNNMVHHEPYMSVYCKWKEIEKRRMRRLCYGMLDIGLFRLAFYLISVGKKEKNREQILYV